MFSNDAFRNEFLSEIGVRSNVSNYERDIDQTLDALADHIEHHLDVDEMLFAAGV